MSLINTNDPTTIGTLIMSAIIVVGALIINHVFKRGTMPAFPGLFTKKDRQPNRQATTPIGSPLSSSHSEQPHKNTALKPHEYSKPATAPYNRLYDGQWNRIADRIDDNITRIKSAARDQTHAITQLDAAEFSLSELFREFPEARKQINPVTYLEFPALKPRQTDNGATSPTGRVQAAGA